jgi:3-deoxy-D-arabino-heptulosonate 7-phosphate (DAHP) synthase class II
MSETQEIGHFDRVRQMERELYATVEKYAKDIQACYESIKASRYRDPQEMDGYLDSILINLIIAFEKVGYEVDFDSLARDYSEEKAYR